MIVPSFETSFIDIRDLINEEFNYYMLTGIKLNEILSDNFEEKFLNDGNLKIFKIDFLIQNSMIFNLLGEIYLLSYNTYLDCHDCVCLLPNGQLILNLTHSNYERIPFEFCKKTKKSDGFLKYGLL